MGNGDQLPIGSANSAAVGVLGEASNDSPARRVFECSPRLLVKTVHDSAVMVMFRPPIVEEPSDHKRRGQNR